VLNVAHRTSRTFVSKSVALTAVEEATFLASALTHRSSYPASLSVSFKVTTLRNVEDRPKATGFIAEENMGNEGTSVGKGTTGRYRLTVLYSVEGAAARPSLNHFLVRNRFVPNLGALLRKAAVQ
jgi:hypothetical protein